MQAKQQESWFTKFHADTIFNQMGGIGKVKAFTGGYHFNYSTESCNVSFKFKARAKQGINYCKVTLTPLDVYEMEFGKIRNSEYTVVKTFDMVYCDQLIEIFENTTGVYLHF